jgi:hypothetical protein
MDRRAKLMGLDAAVKYEDVRKAYDVGTSPDDLWPKDPTTPPRDTAGSAPPVNSSAGTMTKSS